MAFRETLTHYVNAGFPALWVQSHEETRAIQDIVAVAKTLKPPRPVWTWAITEGWKEIGSPKAIKAADPITALKSTFPQPGVTGSSACPEESILILKDFHPYSVENAQVKRVFRDLLPALKSTGRLLLFLSPTVAIPVEWEKEIQVLTYILPNRDELGVILDAVVNSVGASNAKIEDRIAVLEASRGLTASEAENAFSLAIVKHKSFNNAAIKTIQAEKAAAVRKSGILEYFEADVTDTDIGGLNVLKTWLRKRGKAFSDAARAFGLRPPKGVLLMGVPGGGKSLSAKAASNMWKVPILKLDLGKVFGSLVGKSEENMRTACSTADACAPCILWVDEIEKGLAGMASSGATDSGVTSRVFGTFLTWMQEKKSQVFVIATANNVSKIPPEFLRKGRFDEVFAIDLPSASERKEIFEIHLKARERKPEKFDLDVLVAASTDFTGAEIEEVINSALFDAFDAGGDITTESVVKCVKETKPLALTAAEQIATIRKWIEEGRARAASDGEAAAPIGPRKVRRVGLTSSEGANAD